MKHPISPLSMNAWMVLATILLHGAMMVLNELLFRRAEFLQGIGWIYIPAGTRLLCTLLFGPAGAFGLLVMGWIACYWYYFPGDALRAGTGTLAGALGPFLVYLAARRWFGLRSSLRNLTPRRLLACAAACSVASPLLHHLWFMLHGDATPMLPGFLVMCFGDLAGTLVVLYTARALLPPASPMPALSAPLEP